MRSTALLGRRSSRMGSAAVGAAIVASSIAAGGWLPGGPGETTATGAIEGHVTLRGTDLPAPTVVTNTTDPDVCGRSHTLEDLVVAPENRGIRNAVVALEGSGLSGATPPAEPLVLDNVDCRFVPHASVMTVGGVIELTNSDEVLHTAHLYGPVEVNVALPLAGMTVRRRMDAKGMIVVKCDAHGWMQAFIRVDTHRFHDVTDSIGAFGIRGVPPGDYTLSIWHERLGTEQVNVHVASGEITHVAIELGRD